MSYRRTLIGFSLFAVVALLVTYLIYATLLRPVPGGSANTFTTTFNDASGLRARDDVRMAGVRVGRVEKVELVDGNRAKVEFAVDEGQKVCTNTQAQIRYQNLIGQRFLGLNLINGSCQGTLASGELKVPAATSFDVAQLISGFEPLFSTLQPDEINPLADTLVQAFQGDKFSISKAIAQVNGFTASLVGRDQVLNAVISNLSLTMRSLAGQSDSLRGLVGNMSSLVQGLNSNSSVFGKTITDVNTVAEKATPLVSDLRPRLNKVSQDTVRVTDRLISTGARWDRAAPALPKLLASLAKISGSGAYLNVYACDVDISLYGILFPPGLLSNLGSPKRSVVCR